MVRCGVKEADQQALGPRAEGRPADAGNGAQDLLDLSGQGVVAAKVVGAQAEPAGLVGDDLAGRHQRPVAIQGACRLAHPSGQCRDRSGGGGCVVSQRGGKPREECAQAAASRLVPDRRGRPRPIERDGADPLHPQNASEEAVALAFAARAEDCAVPQQDQVARARDAIRRGRFRLVSAGGGHGGRLRVKGQAG